MDDADEWREAQELYEHALHVLQQVKHHVHYIPCPLLTLGYLHHHHRPLSDALTPTPVPSSVRIACIAVLRPKPRKCRGGNGESGKPAAGTASRRWRRCAAGRGVCAAGDGQQYPRRPGRKSRRGNPPDGGGGGAGLRRLPSGLVTRRQRLAGGGIVWACSPRRFLGRGCVCRHVRVL